MANDAVVTKQTVSGLFSGPQQSQNPQDRALANAGLAPGTREDPDASPIARALNSAQTASGNKISNGSLPQNFYGVFQDAPLQQGATMAKTYHGISIAFNNHIVGRIQSWNPQMYTRSGNHIMEIGVRSWGRPVDFVPGPASGFTISCTRAEIWTQEIEKEAGYNTVWVDLREQKIPFTVYETLFWGTQPYRVWVYRGCWFTERNEDAFTAQGTGEVTANCTLSFLSRIRTLLE
jgi:hypothetical protein